VVYNYLLNIDVGLVQIDKSSGGDSMKLSYQKCTNELKRDLRLFVINLLSNYTTLNSFFKGGRINFMTIK